MSKAAQRKVSKHNHFQKYYKAGRKAAMTGCFRGIMIYTKAEENAYDLGYKHGIAESK